MKALLFALGLCSICGSQARLLAQASPVGCDMTLVSVSTASGSTAYMRLRYQIEALAAAESGVTSLKQGLEELNTAPTPSLALSSVITSTNESRDALRCAAAVIAKYSPTNDTDKTIGETLILAYNQEAEVTMDLQASAKKRFLAGTAEQTNAETVKEAEHLSARAATQKEAAESLLEATTMSLILAVDLTDPAAKTTAKSLLSCNEFGDLRTRSSAVSKAEKSAYTDCASLFITFLDGHECRQ
jgi:hypothetical protein